MNYDTLKTVFIATLIATVAAVLVVMSGGSATSSLQAEVQALQDQIASIPTHNPGALAGPDIASPYLNWGNLVTWNAAFSPVSTSTSGVFCSYLLPYGTSTLQLAAWRPDSVGGFGTSQTFDISTSTTVSGSSTPALVLAASFSAAQIWIPEASTTSANPTQVLTNSNTNGNQNVFTVVSSPTAPLYLNWRLATATPSTIAPYPTGNCSAEAITI